MKLQVEYLLGVASMVYGNTAENMRLRLFGNIKPFNRFGGSIYGDIGTVKDTRDDSDFHFGLGFALHFRLIQTSSFSLGPVLNMPFDFHIRTDDEDNEGKSHTVFLPIASPRLGLQSEIMLSPKIDFVIRGEYVLTSVNLDNSWTYTEAQGEGGEMETFNANWNATEEDPIPEIEYQGWIITLGIRGTFFSSFTSH